MALHSKALAKIIFIDLVGSLAWFPIWWYTTGLKKVINSSVSALSYRLRSYGIKVWLVNFFVPMYGQHDLTGKLVSVFMRTMILIGRLIALAIEFTVYVVGVLVWIMFPIFVLLMAIMNLAQGGMTENIRAALYL